jgi:hypothetical protein
MEVVYRDMAAELRALLCAVGFSDSEVPLAARVIREVLGEHGFSIWRFNREHRDIAARLVALGLFKRDTHGELYFIPGAAKAR